MPRFRYLPRSFRDAGYATAGFTQLAGETYARGFEIYERLGGSRRPRRAQRSLDSITGWMESHDERPFFLFLHSYEVHMPYRPAAEFIDRFEHDYSGPLANRLMRKDAEAINSGEMEISDADLQHIVTLYDGDLASFDDTLGRVFDFLRDSGLAESTVIAVVSDHGEEFGEHGTVARHAHALYNELIKTPLIMGGPGVPEGLRVEGYSRNIDVAPTLLELAGVPVPEHFQGFDLAPLWDGEETQSRVVLSERGSHRAFIVDGFKYDTRGTLFDLRNDPTEQHDVSASMGERLAQFVEIEEAWNAELARAQQFFRQPTEVRLTPEEVRRLKALGYLR